VVTPVVFLVSQEELRHILVDSGARAVVTTTELLITVQTAAHGLGLSVIVVGEAPYGSLAEAKIRQYAAIEQTKNQQNDNVREPEHQPYGHDEDTRDLPYGRGGSSGDKPYGGEAREQRYNSGGDTRDQQCVGIGEARLVGYGLLEEVGEGPVVDRDE